MPELVDFSRYYQEYVWNSKHRLYGYPADRYPSFAWIKSLEERFDWLRENCEGQRTASMYLIHEMINWGGSQHGVLQRFMDGCGEVNLYALVIDVVGSLDTPDEAISNALNFPGFGLTYASKLLRFMRPDMYGALDHRIRGALLGIGELNQIHDGNTNSQVKGYLQFLGLLNRVQGELRENNLAKPDCALSRNGVWRPSQVEMALYQWADTVQ